MPAAKVLDYPYQKSGSKPLSPYVSLVFGF